MGAMSRPQRETKYPRLEEFREEENSKCRSKGKFQ